MNSLLQRKITNNIVRSTLDITDLSLTGYKFLSKLPTFEPTFNYIDFVRFYKSQGERKYRKLIRKSLTIHLNNDIHERVKNDIVYNANICSKQYFKSRDIYEKGMKLFAIYNDMQPCGWEEMEEFLEGLDSQENYLLECAISYDKLLQTITK